MIEFSTSRLGTWLEGNRIERKRYHEAFKDHKISYSNFAIMWMIHENNGKTLSELYALDIMDRSHLIINLRRLDEMGIIEKCSRIQSDLRKSRKAYKLSTYGKELFKNLYKQYEKEFCNG